MRSPWTFFSCYGATKKPWFYLNFQNKLSKIVQEYSTVIIVVWRKNIGFLHPAPTMMKSSLSFAFSLIELTFLKRFLNLLTWREHFLNNSLEISLSIVRVLEKNLLFPRLRLPIYLLNENVNQLQFSTFY